MEIKWNTDQLDKYAMNLEQAPARLFPEVSTVMKRLMYEAKRAQEMDFRRSSNRAFRAIASKVRYTDPQVSATGLSSRLGVVKGGAGNLGNLAVFGTWKGGGTHMHPTYHVEQQLPGATSALAEAMAKAVRT